MTKDAQMRVLVSGSHGMIGSAIVEALRARGDEVGALVRGGTSTGLDVAWDVAAGTIDEAALAEGSFDAVIHLAGEPLLGRWTPERRQLILDSRVQGTDLVASAIAGLDPARRPAS
ncbi:MAG: NAD-dependent epimerase/dehydratase family protein, partial [Gaiellales bacterium]